MPGRLWPLHGIATRLRRKTPGNLGAEAMPRDQGVDPLTPRAGIDDPHQRRSVPGKQSTSGGLVYVADRRVVRGAFAPLLENRLDGFGGNILQPQLPLQGALAARPRPVARLDPGAGERLIVEHAELA